MIDPRGAQVAQLEQAIDRAERIVLQIESLFPVNAFALKVLSYRGQRKQYNINIFGAMNGYLTGDDSIVAARNEMSKYATEAFYDAFVAGYTDAGSDESALTGEGEGADDLAWLNDRTEAEIGYIKPLFDSLRDAKKEPDVTRDELVTLAHDRADAYSNGLDMVYAEGKMRGASNIMLTMTGDDGAESCSDCQERKGKRYSARKWLRIGYPPSRDFECHGYNCQHYLETDDGKRWTP